MGVMVARRKMRVRRDEQVARLDVGPAAIAASCQAIHEGHHVADGMDPSPPHDHRKVLVLAG